MFPFGSRICLKRYDIEAEIAKLDSNVLHVMSDPPTEFYPGMKLDYSIRALSNRGGLKYRLEAGPGGMTVSAAGRVEWSAPIDAPQRQTAVIAVSDRSTKTIFHNITLVRGAIPTFEVPLNATAEIDPGALKVAVRLPAPADDFVIGAGGRYVLAPMNSRRQIAVISVDDRKVLKLIPTDADVKVAAGAKSFVVYSAKGELSRWSFKTLERELAISLTDEVQSMCMGLDSEGPLLLSVRKSGNFEARFLDLSSIKPAELSIHSSRDGRVDPSIDRHVAASADGRTFSSWGTMISTMSGINSYVVRGKQVIACKRPVTAGPVTPSPDGSILYTWKFEFDSRETRGKIDNRNFGTPTRPRKFSIPAATGCYYLHWTMSPVNDRGGQVALHTQLNSQPILTIADLEPPSIPVDEDGEDPLFSRRLIYVPAADSVLSIGPLRRSLVIQRFSLDKALETLGKDYLFVTSTAPSVTQSDVRMTYQIEVRSRKGGTKFVLERGPQGAKVSPTGLVVWDVNENLKASHEFVVQIVDDSGAKTSHRFNVMIEKHGPFDAEPMQVADASGAAADSTVATKMRNWKSIDGEYSLEARFVKITGDTVTLVRPDGESFEVMLEMLSADDRQFLNKNR